MLFKSRGINDYDTVKLRTVIRNNIISRHHLEYIRDWLWRNSWAPFVGMIYKYV